MTILTPLPGKLGSARVRSCLPQPARDRVSPFLTLDHYGPTPVPAGWTEGVQDHLHAGHEVLSILLEGELEHRDSAGNDVLLRPGDLQRMTTARGLIHRETLSPAFRAAGGVFHGVQVWIDLPPDRRRRLPTYQHVPARDVPVVAPSAGTGSVRVLAGSHGGVHGPVTTHLPVRVLHGRLDDGARLSLEVGPEENAAVYVVGGCLRVPILEGGLEGPGDLGGPIVPGGPGGEARIAERPGAVEEILCARGTDDPAPGEAQLLVLARDGNRVEVEAAGGAEILVLAGAPRPGDLARDGAVIMDRPAEIEETRRAHRAGHLGRIPR